MTHDHSFCISNDLTMGFRAESSEVELPCEISKLFSNAIARRREE
jgi:hypothetical protein